jgi:hypothetical protein
MGRIRAVALGALLVAHTALALVCPTPVGAEALASVDAELRLAFLAAEIDREVHHIDVWSWSWGSTYAALAVGQASAIPFVHDKGAQETLAVGAVAATFGAGSLFGLPLLITRPLERVRASWDDPRRCELLAEAEATLFAAAHRQALSTNWTGHVGNILFNTGLLLVLGWGYGHWGTGALSAGIGVAVGEANLLTQPRGLQSSLSQYDAGRPGAPVPTTSWSAGPLWAPGVCGLGVMGRW